MAIHPLIASVALICVVSVTGAVGGAVLKRAADHAHAGLFLAALLIYSISSYGLYRLYRLDSNASFALTTFTALLGSLLATQLISATIFHESVNWRAFTVLTLAIAAFVWATQPRTDVPNIPTPSPIKGEAS